MAHRVLSQRVSVTPCMEAVDRRLISGRCSSVATPSTRITIPSDDDRVCIRFGEGLCGMAASHLVLRRQYGNDSVYGR